MKETINKETTINLEKRLSMLRKALKMMMHFKRSKEATRKRIIHYFRGTFSRSHKRVGDVVKVRKKRNKFVKGVLWKIVCNSLDVACLQARSKIGIVIYR